MNERLDQRSHGARAAWRRLVSLTKKEVRQLLRDKSNLAIGVGLPIILILIFGYGISLDLQNARVAVVYEDASPGARQAFAGLDLSRYLDQVPTRTMAEARALMSDRRVDAIVRVPPTFAADLAAGSARLQLVVHGSDAAMARAVEAYVSGALAQRARGEADRAAVGSDKGSGVRVDGRLWFNEANTSTWYLVPGLIVLIMTLVGAFLTSLVVAREWERGTLEALFVTPARPGEILLAKMIPYFLVGFAGLVLCVLAARFLFHVPLRGSILSLFIGSVLYLFTALGIGLLISSATRNQFLASQIALVSSFLPALMLSGFIFDLRNVPVVISVIGHVIPATHFLEVLRAVFLVGDVWKLILTQCAILLLYSVAFLALARAVTRKRLA